MGLEECEQENKMNCVSNNKTVLWVSQVKQNS